MKKQRITLDMSIQDIAIEISREEDGGYNPGALRVSVDLLHQAGAIDPDNALGGLGVILSLDTFQIYGHKIWILYKDICGESIPLMVSVLRAVQQGMFPVISLKNAIDEHELGRPKNPILTSEKVEALRAELRKQLPNFKG